MEGVLSAGKGFREAPASDARGDNSQLSPRAGVTAVCGSTDPPHTPVGDVGLQAAAVNSEVFARGPRWALPSDNRPQTGLPKHKHFSRGSGGYESKSKTPAESVSGEHPLPGLQTAVSSRCPQTAETGRDEQRSKFSSIFSCEGSVTIVGPTPQTSSKPNQLQKPSPWGLGFQHMNLGGT